MARPSHSHRLNTEEELDLLVRAERGTPGIKNRLSYLKAHDGHHTEVLQHPAPMQVCGQPWNKLCMLRQSYLYSQGASLQRVQYKSLGDELTDEKCLQVIWEDELLADEESGANRQLGFLFLYLLLTDKVCPSPRERPPTTPTLWPPTAPC